MRKSDLRNGMVVETRDGMLYLVVGDFFTRQDGFMILSSYNEDMTRFDIYDDFDIMKVYEYDNPIYRNNAAGLEILFNKEYLTLLWGRKELTKHEVEVLKALQVLGFGWLARDENGDLFAYRNKPIKVEEYWSYYGLKEYEYLDDDLFAFVKGDDKEPTNINNLQSANKEGE